MEIRIANRFSVYKRIGSGAFGQIYEGFDHLTQERVSIKLVRSYSLFLKGVYDSEVPLVALRSQSDEALTRC